MRNLLQFFQAFFLPANQLRVCFNPEMSYEKRQATIWTKEGDGVLDVVGITLNHPKVLTFMRKHHLHEIVRQAKICGFEPTHISTDTIGTRVWPLTEAARVKMVSEANDTMYARRDP
jgi:hypothetical protein